MEVLYLLIGISLAVALVFLFGFLWAVRSRQYEDDFTPSVRMLFEDGAPGKGRNRESDKIGK